MKTKAIIVTGSTSSGKTELAKALQEALLPEIWLNYSVDSLIDSLPPSVLERCNNEDDWSGVDGSLLYSSSIACLRNLVSLGNRVIFDAVLVNEMKAKELLGAFDNGDVFTVFLHSNWKEIEERTNKRRDRSLSEAKRSFDQSSDHIKSDIILDTTNVAPSVLAKQVVKHMMINK